MKETDKLIRSLFSVVIIRGEVAEVAIRSIEANLPYVNDQPTVKALEKAAQILSEQLWLADDILWQELTRGKRIATD